MSEENLNDNSADLVYVTVGRVDEWEEDQSRAVEVGDRVVAIFRHAGQFYAIDDMCPHMGASLASGHFDPQTMAVACPWHGWRFDVRDGTWCDNRRIKTDAFPVRVVEDQVQIGVSRDDKPKWKSATTFRPIDDAAQAETSSPTAEAPTAAKEDRATPQSDAARSVDAPADPTNLADRDGVDQT